MPNAIPCKHCGKQCTDHTENYQTFNVVSHKKLPKDLQNVVCDKYTPDIKEGKLFCTCSKQERKKWCNGLCIFIQQIVESD